MRDTLGALFLLRERGPVSVSTVSSFVKSDPVSERQRLKGLYEKGLACADCDLEYFAISPRGATVIARSIHDRTNSAPQALQR